MKLPEEDEIAEIFTPPIPFGEMTAVIALVLVFFRLRWPITGLLGVENEFIRDSGKEGSIEFLYELIVSSVLCNFAIKLSLVVNSSGSE